METESKSKSASSFVKVDSGSGIFWLIGWLFTMAFAHLGLWQALLGLIVWPYYLGLALR